jgi:hypothetical protein
MNILKKIWREVKRPFIQFHEWIKSIAPGVKTKTILFLGWVGSTAALMQEFVSGLPLSQIVGVTEAVIISAVLFSIAFWTNSMRAK